MSCCPKCGQTLPPDIPKGLKVRAGELRLFELVNNAGKHGIWPDDLFDKLYDDHPDGGPEYGKNTMASRIVHLNKKLKKLGLMIRSGSGRGTNPYRILKVKEVA